MIKYKGYKIKIIDNEGEMEVRFEIWKGNTLIEKKTEIDTILAILWAKEIIDNLINQSV